MSISEPIKSSEKSPSPTLNTLSRILVAQAWTVGICVLRNETSRLFCFCLISHHKNSSVSSSDKDCWTSNTKQTWVFVPRKIALKGRKTAEVSTRAPHHIFLMTRLAFETRSVTEMRDRPFSSLGKGVWPIAFALPRWTWNGTGTWIPGPELVRPAHWVVQSKIWKDERGKRDRVCGIVCAVEH